MTVAKEIPWRQCSLLGLFGIVAIGLLTVGDYGRSWDEPYRFYGGDLKYRYYANLLDGKDAPEFDNLYPGLFDLPLAIFRNAFPELGSPSLQGHVWSFFWGFVGLVSAWRIAARLGGERAGFWALLLLALTPRYYGHMFFNPKDIPFAATYLLSILAIIGVLEKLPQRPGWAPVLWVGVAAGLTLSARIGGMLVLFYFALFIGLYLLVRYARQWRARGKLEWGQFGRDIGFWAVRGVATGLLAGSILLVFWPIGHANPLGTLQEAISEVQQFGWDGLVLMDGAFWKAQDLPPTYIPYWLMVTQPELVFVLLLVFALVAMLSLFQYARAADWPPYGVFLPRLLLVFSFAFPLGYMLYKQPVLYDGMRHFLFVVPPLICVLALTLEWCLRQLESARRKRLAGGVQVAVGVWAVFMIVEMVRLHPYQHVYFNHTSGGLQGALHRDETDYWGTSYREAGLWLNEYVAGLSADGEPHYKVYVPAQSWMLKPYLSSQLELTKSAPEADFIVAITRLNMHLPAAEKGSILHVVERKQTPLCLIFDMSKPPSVAAPSS